MGFLLNKILKPINRKWRQIKLGYCQRKNFPPDFDELAVNVWNSVKNFTMTSPERVNALVESVRYIEQNNIDGAMVECGVWKGGSTMALAKTLLALGNTERDIFLYDTFSGMSEPTAVDVSLNNESAINQYELHKTTKEASNWAAVTLDEVKKNVLSTGYPPERIHFIKGKVENTIPNCVPKSIALLRLDTDWYESTKHELVHMFPLISHNGVIIIDDYGHWLGTKKAVDEYIAENNICILLNRIDYTGRIAIKIG